MTGNEPVETPDVGGAFPRLSEGQIEFLSTFGERRPTHEGDVLVRERERERPFYVVLSGKVAVVDGHGTPDAKVIRAETDVDDGVREANLYRPAVPAFSRSVMCAAVRSSGSPPPSARAPWRSACSMTTFRGPVRSAGRDGWGGAAST